MIDIDENSEIIDIYMEEEESNGLLCMCIMLFNSVYQRYVDWVFSTIEIDGCTVNFDMLDLKYFKINEIGNLKDLFFWINIDIDQYSSIEILSQNI